VKAEEEPWRATLETEIDNIQKITGKPILLGLFVHDYGQTGKAVPMNVLELQFQKAADWHRKARRRALSCCKTAGSTTKPTGRKCSGSNSTSLAVGDANRPEMKTGRISPSSATPRRPRRVGGFLEIRYRVRNVADLEGQDNGRHSSAPIGTFAVTTRRPPLRPLAAKMGFERQTPAVIGDGSAKEALMRDIRQWLFLLLACSAASQTAGAEQVVRLKEYLGHTFTEQLISYPLDAALREVASLQVVDANGRLAAVSDRGRPHLSAGIAPRRQRTRLHHPPGQPAASDRVVRSWFVSEGIRERLTSSAATCEY